MAGQALSVLIFSIITLGLGYAVLALARATRQKNPILYVVELAAVGLATFSFLGVVLNLLRIPLHYLIYLGITLALVLLGIAVMIRGKDKLTFEWRKQETICAILLIVILAGYFALFLRGANAYPYLEDDDPWGHALGASYVSRAHTYSVDPEVRDISNAYAIYLEPYPPTYDVIMGVMRQTNDSIVWTLKYFNVLLITLGLAFAYLLAKTYLGSDIKALLATFILACIPSFMSHFIWSQTLALVLAIAALYAFIKALNDPTWCIPAVILIASEMVTQPVVSFVFGLIVILMIAAVFLHELFKEPEGKGSKAKDEKKARKASLLQRFPMTATGFSVAALGVIASVIYWGAQLAKWTIAGFIKLRGKEFASTSGWLGSYGTPPYTLSDVLFAPMQGKIDQATGWGIGISLMLLLSLVVVFILARKRLNPRQGWMYLHLLAWFLLFSYMLFAPTFGLPSFGSYRAWAYLAVPLAFIIAEGSVSLVNSVSKQGLVRVGLLVAIAAVIAATSVPAKIAVQTAQWPPGAQWTMIQTPQGVQSPDLVGYMQMQQTLPKNSRVYPFCGGDQRTIGFDMQSDPWDKENAMFRQRSVNATGDEIIAFLTSHNYQYVTFDVSCVREWGENETAVVVDRISQTGRFRPVITQQGFILAQLT